MNIPWGERVRAAREASCITQEQLAQRLHMHWVTIARWEGLARRPYSKSAEKFLAIEERMLEGTLPTGNDPEDIAVWWRAIEEGGVG